MDRVRWWVTSHVPIGNGPSTLPTVEALAIFTGANAYVSPNWYPAEAEHGKVVPTWNYETVHVRGVFVAHDDAEWKRALVTRLTQRHESQFDVPWAVDDAPPDYIDVDAESDRGHRVARSRRFKANASSARTARRKTSPARSPA